MDESTYDELGACTCPDAAATTFGDPEPVFVQGWTDTCDIHGSPPVIVWRRPHLNPPAPPWQQPAPTVSA